jgi:hypothetical protein
MIDEGNLQRWDDYGVFSVILICTNRACRQGASALGDYSTQQADPSEHRWEYTYTVRDIHPAPLLINIPENLPKPIAGALERGFTLYWRDPQACAVTIRTAIDGITEHLRQHREVKGKFIPLATRLNNLRSKHPDLVEAAEAIKDIGNDGAHGDEVDRDKLLAAYELLEIELLKLFDDTASRRQTLMTKLRS